MSKVTLTYPDRDPAFREHASGLIVPAAISREREVWTRDEWRLVERSTKLLKKRGIAVFYKCTAPSCQEQPIGLVRDPQSQALSLRCAHRDRIMSQSF